MAKSSQNMTYDEQTTGEVCTTGYRLAALYQTVLQTHLNWSKSDFEAAAREIFQNDELNQRVDDVAQQLFEAAIEGQGISGRC